MNFVADIKRRGHSVAIVSDSHAAYVGPVSEKVFGTPWLALADKPNTARLRAFLESEFGFPRHSLPEEYLLVGDTRLDIQVARGLSLPSALIFRGVDDVPHDPYHNEESAWARRYMEGATYTCRSFEDLMRVVESPAKQRLVLEDQSVPPQLDFTTEETGTMVTPWFAALDASNRDLVTRTALLAGTTGSAAKIVTKASSQRLRRTSTAIFGSRCSHRISCDGT